MNHMTIELRQDNGKHLYEQIYLHIRREIRKGKLLQGEKLPSTRSLAEFLQVSRSTVELAYDQLLSEGYIEAKPYRGYFVCPGEGLLDMGEEMPEDGWKGWKNEEKERKEGHGTYGMYGSGQTYEYDFSPNTIDMSAFPYATWKKITKGILVDANSEMFLPGSPKGDFILRETIAHYLHTSRLSLIHI